MGSRQVRRVTIWWKDATGAWKEEATFVDVTGIVIYFSIAQALLF